MYKVAIILPAYNEELTIASTIIEFYNAFPDALIVIINNNSTDKTAAIAYNTITQLNALGCVLHEFQQGKGNAVRRGFTEIQANIYVMADADLTYPANRIHDLIRPITDNLADMVVGDRISGGHYQKENKRKFHDFGNKLVKYLINKMFCSNLKDVMSGYRAFSHKFVKNYPILVEGFQIETDMTLHALDKRFRIKEIPIEYKERPYGSISKLNTFIDGINIIFTLFQIFRYYRPLMFFGCICISFFLLGILAGYPVIDDWLRFRYVFHVPLAILAVGLEMFAIMTMGIGLVLDSIIHHNKLDYERKLLSDENLFTKNP